MPKTFTAQEAIDLTYNYGQSSTSQSLDFFMKEAKLRPFKGSNSVYIHAPEASDLDLTVNIEAYDDDFEEATKTDKLFASYRDRVYKYLKQLFPEMFIGVVWYSGYNYHHYHILDTRKNENDETN